MEKVMLFVDGSNLYMGAKRFKEGTTIDYEKLKALLAGGRRLIRSYYYGSFNPNDATTMQRQRRFFEALERSGFDTTVSPLRKREGKLIEKGADVSLAIDMVSLGLRGAFDTAILVSGDDDFLKAVEEVKRAGKTVEVAYFEGATGRHLRNCADSFVDLGIAFEKIIRQKKQNH